MDLVLTEDRATATFRLSGTLTYRDNRQFNRVVQRLAEESGDTVTLDLANLEYMDSFGIGLMVLAQGEATKHGRKLLLTHVRKEVHALFERLDLLSELPIEAALSTPPATPPSVGERLQVSALIDSGADARVCLSGRFNVNDQHLFLPVITAISKRNSGRVIIDIGALTFMDSSGLSMIMLANDQARRASQVVAIANPRGAVKDLLKLAAIDLIVPIYDDH